MKPLYLRGSATRVAQDGPALKVEQPGQSACWFPLRRISRVISAPQVGWTSEALLACVAEGVSVTFMADSGAVLARLVGRPGEREEIRQRLADLLVRPGWPDDYAAWLAGMEQMAARSVARRAGFPLERLPTPRDLRRCLRDRAAAGGLLEPYAAVGRTVHGLLLAYVTQALSAAGVGVEWSGWTQLDLPGDLTRVLFWDFRLARLAWLERCRQQGAPLPPPDRAVVAFFEERHGRIEHLCRGLLNRLHQWLIEQYRWH